MYEKYIKDRKIECFHNKKISCNDQEHPIEGQLLI